MKIRLFGTVNDSIVDGPGLRYSVFTQGCLHHCPGCHNPRSHDLEGGYFEDIDKIVNKIKKNPLLDGVTISGGEPFLQPIALIGLATKVKQLGLHLMIYSGYTYEEILRLGENERKLLSLCDVLVDGRFLIEQRSLSLLYKGSANQRVINVQASLKEKCVVIQKINDYGEFIE